MLECLIDRMLLFLKDLFILFDGVEDMWSKMSKMNNDYK
jgi:hypothetical protein